MMVGSHGGQLNRLYAFGSNGSGQLLLGHDEDVSEPSQCLHDFNSRGLLYIVGSGNLTLLQFDNGSCFIAGNKNLVQLPQNAQASEKLSDVVEIPRTAICSATWDAFAIVAETPAPARQVINTFGAPEKGQLGRNPHQASLQIALPLSVADDTTINCIAGGVQHFVAVLSTGEVIGWGNGRKGQLGQPAGIVESPRKILGIEFKVKYAVCGREFTYLLGEPVEGHHLVLGSDKWNVRSQAPKSVKNWRSAGAHWGGISVLLDDGRLLSWGRDDHGQAAPSGLPPLEMFAAGSEHSVALSKAGDILVWGWGEHGNCGSQTDQHGDVKGRWDVVRKPELSHAEHVLGVGAGCATSWFWVGTKPGA